MSCASGADAFAAGYRTAATNAFGSSVSRFGYAIAGTSGATAYDPCVQLHAAPADCALDDREAWYAANPVLACTSAIASALAYAPALIHRIEGDARVEVLSHPVRRLSRQGVNANTT